MTTAILELLSSVPVTEEASCAQRLCCAAGLQAALGAGWEAGAAFGLGLFGVLVLLGQGT